MNHEVLLSKIVANSTDTTWAQAYTTLNVYVALSIQTKDAKHHVATLGKELLEKIQREFFALDDKSLENIKKAIGNATKGLEESNNFSVVVGAIVNNILYIVIASDGIVTIRRGSKSGIIAKGTTHELHGFSGKISHDDIICLQTGDFADKLPLSELSEYLKAGDVLQIAENITPLIHGDSKGTESAIIIQYKDLQSKTKENDESDSDSSEFTTHEESRENSKPVEENLWTKPIPENKTIEELNEEENPHEERAHHKKPFSFSIPKKFLVFNKKIAIVLAIILLVIMLGGGVMYQTAQKNDQKAKEAFAAIISPMQTKFKDASDLASLNSSLALDDLNSTLTQAKNAFANYKEGSEEYNSLKSLIGQIESKISSIGGGGKAQNVKDFITPNDKIKDITDITLKGGMLLILDKDGEQVVTIDSKGSIKKTYDIKSKDSFISADDKFIYTMGEGATSIDRGNGKVTKLTEEIEGEAFDIFGSNIYTLNNNDILKYKAPSYSSSSYFTDKPQFSTRAVDFSISGPVWIIEENGTISRFTKGKRDDFELSGLQGNLGSGSKIYADADNDNLYVLDSKNQRVVAFSDKGVYQKQYEGSFLKDAKDFAIDEKNNSGFVISGGKVVSFDL